MDKIDLSKKNPFQSYTSNFGAYFSFGKDFDDWVCETMLEALLLPGDRDESLIRMVDIGAGSCYWARLFLRSVPTLRITAVDPSANLVLSQATKDLAEESEEVRSRLSRRCATAQDFARECKELEQSEQLDCVYFMQSAHYIGDNEFDDVIRDLARGLKPEVGRIVIQARNMTKDWYPWAFPYEWKDRVEGALHATSMFGRADRYKEKLEAMDSVFSSVSVHERAFDVYVDADDYWDRLENRWIPTFMSEEIIPPRLHRQGIDAMRQRFASKNETRVHWLEKYALVIARA